MQDESRAYQDKREMNVIFVHSELDDANLSAAEFRVYCHLARRAGTGEAFPGIDSISKKCCLSKPTVIQSIRSLENLKMIRADRRPGMTTRYVLTAKSAWNLSNTDQSNSGNGLDTGKKEVTDQSNIDNATSKKEVTKGNPTKVIQKGNPGMASLENPPLPEMFQTDEFRTLWSEWLEDRRVRKKPVTVRAAKLQFKKLSEWSLFDAKSAIENAIASGWQSFFRPDRMSLTDAQKQAQQPRKRYDQPDGVC